MMEHIFIVYLTGLSRIKLVSQMRPSGVMSFWNSKPTLTEILTITIVKTQFHDLTGLNIQETELLIVFSMKIHTLKSK